MKIHHKHVTNVDVELIPDYIKKQVLIIGCGNILFGDDGFGPAVVEYLEKNYKIPKDIYVMDSGMQTAVILFTILLSEVTPNRIIIVDAIDKGRVPGDVFEISIDDMPSERSCGFLLSQLPSSNLLKELRDFRNIKIIPLVCQIESIPDAVNPGLSKPVHDAIPRCCELIMGTLVSSNNNEG